MDREYFRLLLDGQRVFAQSEYGQRVLGYIDHLENDAIQRLKTALTWDEVMKARGVLDTINKLREEMDLTQYKGEE